MKGTAAGLGLIVVGLALLGLAWVGSQRKLKRNYWAGIRTRATMSSDEAWYAAHETAAGPLGLTGGLVALLGVGVISTGFDIFGQIATIVGAVAIFVGLVVSTVLAQRAARRIQSNSA